MEGSLALMELLVKKKAQDPLVARPASRPTFALLMGYKRSLVDTCKSSNVLIVSTLVVFMYSLCCWLFFLVYTNYVMKNCHC